MMVWSPPMEPFLGARPCVLCLTSLYYSVPIITLGGY